ncbi:nitrate- and nitrite sensing domain-containing protein [Streptomyces sp. NPDC088725]|uniref:sensor histidine kinase n=1 Tax=Streptomyces sp. NPDC088725 TaxID=3365873 RepID=UPI003828EF59
MAAGPPFPATGTGPGATEAPAGRRSRVRNRLVAGVAVVGITVVGAGVPGALDASAALNDAQGLVTLAELNRQAVTLAQSLADERDDVVVFVAAGRDKAADDVTSGGATGTSPDGGKKGKGAGQGVAGDHSARVDRQIDEIRALDSASPDLLHDLSAVPTIRRTALTGKGSAMEAYRAYSEVIDKLTALADELAEKTPPEAADGTRGPAALDRAVEQASATRGLLLAALAVPGGTNLPPQFDPITGLPVDPVGQGDPSKNDETRDALSAAAQQSRVRELAALADFDQTADTAAHDSFEATVTGPDVKTAEGFLGRFTDRPELSDSDREADPDKVGAALSARIDQMRGVESGLGSAQVRRLEALRDDAVTDLELRIALLGGCLLIAVGVSTAVARTLTRPLAVVRIGAARIAADPAGEEPVRFTGRNDEFAQVVRSLNGLHAKLLDLSGRTKALGTDTVEPAVARVQMVDHRAELQQRTADITLQLQQLRHTVHHTFVNLSLRTLGLVERQLGVIESMEEREQDPERLATLFKLDHLATVMRRYSENLLVLADHEHGHSPTGPVPLVDVLRAAVSEIERYERITIQSLPAHAQVAGFAADDLSHLVAELLENATSFSPPDAQVQLSGWLLESGEIVLSVQDQGIGLSPDRLTELNARLAGTDDSGENTGQMPQSQLKTAYGIEAEGLGLRVTALLAARHGVRVELREQEEGGLAAVVVLPETLLPTSPSAGAPYQARRAGAAPALTLPGSVAEANSNTLPGRGDSADQDPVKGQIRAGSPERVRGQVPSRETEHGHGQDEAGETEHGRDRNQSRTQAEVPAPRQAQDRDVDPDPLVAAAERTIRETEAAEAAQAAEAADGAQRAFAPHAAQPGPYAIGPDAHERTPDAEPPVTGTDQDTFTLRLPELPERSARPERPENLAESAPAPAPAPEQDSAAEHEAAPENEPLTDKGLPKRTPKVVKPAAAPSERTGSVDAEELRRRLGGFHQGAKDGRRDVEAELTDPAAQGDRTEQGDHTAQTERTDQTGETVEEARS